MVGDNWGTIKQSYASDNSIKGASQGSLVGLNDSNPAHKDKSIVQESYALTDDTAKLKLVGGFKGTRQVNDSYSFAVTFFYDSDDKIINSAAPGSSEHQTTFKGFDFTSVWGIDEGKSTPYLLQNEQKPHPVAP